MIYVSPFVRTEETAKIIADILKLDQSKIVTDDRLHEIYAGTFDGKTDTEYQRYFSNSLEKFTKNFPGGENYTQVKNRMTEFIYDINAKNKDKTIGIIWEKLAIVLTVLVV